MDNPLMASQLESALSQLLQHEDGAVFYQALSKLMRQTRAPRRSFGGSLPRNSDPYVNGHARRVPVASPLVDQTLTGGAQAPDALATPLGARQAPSFPTQQVLALLQASARQRRRQDRTRLRRM